MGKFLNLIKNFINFVSNQLWKVRLNKVDKRQGVLIKSLRVLALSIKKFQADKCLTTATALTYYSIFSIVPILALVFAIAKGFGFKKTLKVELQEAASNYPEYSNIFGNALEYADALLKQTQGGVIAGIGIILLLWSVMSLLINIENIFNQIWEVRRGRTWARKITDYLTIMLVSPLLLIISGGITVSIQNHLGNLGAAGTFFASFLAYALIAGVFTFLYVVMPNRKIQVKSAFIAAVIATVLFELLSWAYINFQVGANRLNAIYGGFAALPLFLIWVQYSWYVVLYGAEVAYSVQHIDHYELEEDAQNLSVRYKSVIALMIANLVAKRFYNREKSLTVSEISQQLDLPLRLTNMVVQEFVSTGIFAEVHTDEEKTVYQPGVTESKFTVKYLIDTIEQRGVNNMPITETQELIQAHALMKEVNNLLDNPLGRQLIKDIVK
ncbi:MAG: YihY/virulence factor BrkB family protein [Bacteroidetes bacterium]|nr:YihY/virulence factor BrkB family protein [Bacteroidota bacterium]